MASRGVLPAPRPKFSGRPWPVTFSDVASQSGLTFPVVYGEAGEKQYIFEANGPGVAFYDYDNDGWIDAFVPNGTLLGGFPPGEPRPSNRLYHNNRDGTFTDVTDKAGLTHTGWCYGVCIGDYDNDGHDDLFLAYYGENVLYHNNGDGTFTDVTKKAGLAQSRPRFSTGCTFVDYDRDGHLDLFVSRYIDSDFRNPATSRDSKACKFEGVPVACGPLGLTGEMCSLYHNNGDGTFTDVSEKAGIAKVGRRYGLTALAFDYNNDGWPDLYVANDFETPDRLYLNKGDGTFVDVVDERLPHVTYFSMGADAGDLNNDGLVDFVITDMRDRNHAEFMTGMEEIGRGLWEMERVTQLIPQYMWNAVYLNSGTDRFQEVARLTGMAATGWTWSTSRAGGRRPIPRTTRSSPPSRASPRQESCP